MSRDLQSVHVHNMSEEYDLEEITDAIGQLLDERKVEAHCYKCSKKLVPQEFRDGKCGFCGPIDKDVIRITPLSIH